MKRQTFDHVMAPTALQVVSDHALETCSKNAHSAKFTFSCQLLQPFLSTTTHFINEIKQTVNNYHQTHFP